MMIAITINTTDAAHYIKTEEEAIAAWNRRTPYETNSNT